MALRQLLLGAAIAVMTGCGTQAVKHDPMTSISFQDDNRVFAVSLNPNISNIPFRGQLPDSAEGQVGNMAYPATDAYTALLSLAVHSAAQSGISAMEDSAEQRAANEVLLPYQAAIAQIDTATMSQYVGEHLQQVVPHLVAGNDSEPSTGSNVIAVDAMPYYTMSRTADALFIDNIIVFDANTEQARTMKVRVKRYPVTDIGSWEQDDFAEFHLATRELLAVSIEAALRYASGESSAAPKMATVRFIENSSKKVERGRVLAESCRYTMFESLRGELTIVPRLKVDDVCATQLSMSF
ncbi:hypothetical protein [Oceanobacter kriegii]|uniref:hypothetical protein n=1 Tax=Oceanobacter kriegii TaxID=64972 RepID=UPI00041232C1|nr:hypothetical protein [Oceanobacter kriegii]